MKHCYGGDLPAWAEKMNLTRFMGQLLEESVAGAFMAVIGLAVVGWLGKLVLERLG